MAITRPSRTRRTMRTIRSASRGPLRRADTVALACEKASTAWTALAVATAGDTLAPGGHSPLLRMVSTHIGVLMETLSGMASDADWVMQRVSDALTLISDLGCTGRYWGSEEAEGMLCLIEAAPEIYRHAGRVAVGCSFVRVAHQERAAYSSLRHDLRSLGLIPAGMPGFHQHQQRLKAANLTATNHERNDHHRSHDHRNRDHRAGGRRDHQSHAQAA